MNRPKIRVYNNFDFLNDEGEKEIEKIFKDGTNVVHIKYTESPIYFQQIEFCIRRISSLLFTNFEMYEIKIMQNHIDLFKRNKNLRLEDRLIYIDSLIERNNNCIKACRNACLTFLAMAKFRLNISKDIAKIIAQLIWSSRRNKGWDIL